MTSDTATDCPIGPAVHAGMAFADKILHAAFCGVDGSVQFNGLETGQCTLAFVP